MIFISYFQFHIDSAAIMHWQVGNPIDKRTVAVLTAKHIDMFEHVARQVSGMSKTSAILYSIWLKFSCSLYYPINIWQRTVGADDLCDFPSREFQQPIKMLRTNIFDYVVFGFLAI